VENEDTNRLSPLLFIGTPLLMSFGILFLLDRVTKRFLPDKSSIIAVERRFVTAHLFMDG